MTETVEVRFNADKSRLSAGACCIKCGNGFTRARRYRVRQVRSAGVSSFYYEHLRCGRHVIGGVVHTLVPGKAINYHVAERKIENRHPAGDVYVVKAHGYVQCGTGWLRFPLKHLSRW